MEVKEHAFNLVDTSSLSSELLRPVGFAPSGAADCCSHSYNEPCPLKMTSANDLKHLVKFPNVLPSSDLHDRGTSAGVIWSGMLCCVRRRSLLALANTGTQWLPFPGTLWEMAVAPGPAPQISQTHLESA